MKIEIEIESCSRCPYATNSAREHNDPFASAPLYTYWWCVVDGQDIEHPNKILATCPKRLNE